ncbi:MAG: hypothetical protein RPU61_03465 [Candidatus Sedimenticola sp. (ex Thyasira tokunagai)]
MMTGETCYMCDQPRTSREHAPPKCLFPVAKEIGQDMRRNLIKVPSCDAHNSEKSEDDEFMRAIILFSAAENNEVAQHQFLGKLLRATKRSPLKYSNYIEEKGIIESERKRVMEIDRDRFDSCIEHMVRAMFFHAYGTKWRYPILVASPNLHNEDPGKDAVYGKKTADLVKIMHMIIGQEQFLGDNPSVFKYRLRHDVDSCSYAFEGIFYDFFEVYTFSTNENA